MDRNILRAIAFATLSVGVTKRALCACILAVYPLTGVAVPVLAQVSATTANLSGVVFDQSRAVVPGATVTATNVATGLERSATAGADGRYVIPALPPGVYSVTAVRAGFVATPKDNVRLALGEAVLLDFTLTVAGRSESVRVDAEPALATMRQVSVATLVSERQIEALPTNGRNFIGFSVITPGVNVDRTPQQGPAASSGLTFLGQRGRSNNITVDGLDNNDIIAGGVRATFSQEAVREFHVLASSYPAEFGKAAGGVVNIVTKSGTNTRSGNVFAYFRDDALNAKEHFEQFKPDGEPIDRRKAPYRQLQFGGTAGGPLRRNHSFYFLSAERLRVSANNFVNIDDRTVEILRRANFMVEPGYVPYRFEIDQVLAKVDIRMKQNHEVSLRFNWADLLDENSEPWGGQVARSRGAYLDSRDLVGAALFRSVFSPRTVNELRFQVANRNQKVVSFDPGCGGVCDEFADGGPAVDVGPIQAGRHPFTPQPRRNRHYQVVDTFSHVIGRQVLKFGADLSWFDQPYTALPLSFGGSYWFQSAEALAAGRPALYRQGYGNPSTNEVAIRDVSLFMHDDWRVCDRLTLQAGVRYQNQFFPQMMENVPGLPAYGWPADNNNLAPRIGLSWSPFRNGRTSVNGSYGVFYGNQLATIWGVPYMIRGTPEHVRVLVAPPPTALEAWNAPARRLAEPATYSSLTITFDPQLKTPYAHHASIGIDGALRAGIEVSARAVYIRGFDQVGQLEYNPVVNGARLLDVNGIRGTSASILQFTSWADSWYRGLIVSVRKNLGARSQFLAVYTLSKAEDMATDHVVSQPQENGFGRNPVDPTGLPLGFNPDSERGPSLQDQRHRFVLSGLYLLPARITVSGIITVGAGRPYAIIAGSDLNGDGILDNDRPWRVANELTTRIGRNTGLLPATSTLDVRVAKRFGSGRRSLDLILEVFNLLNHTNYTAVNAVFGQGSYPDEPLTGFGLFTKAGPPFQAQLAVRISL